jgi:hypothetical protein
MVEDATITVSGPRSTLAMQTIFKPSSSLFFNCGNNREACPFRTIREPGIFPTHFFGITVESKYPNSVDRTFAFGRP